jgi:hypothetical protein
MMRRLREIGPEFVGISSHLLLLSRGTGRYKYPMTDSQGAVSSAATNGFGRVCGPRRTSTDGTEGPHPERHSREGEKGDEEAQNRDT